MLKKNKYFFPVSILVLVIVLIAAIGFGAVSIRPAEMFSSLKHFFRGKLIKSISQVQSAKHNCFWRARNVGIRQYI